MIVAKDLRLPEIFAYFARSVAFGYMLNYP